jgi:hypothetical protein
MIKVSSYINRARIGFTINCLVKTKQLFREKIKLFLIFTAYLRKKSKWTRDLNCEK